MNVAYLCLGGNIGDRESSIKEAIIQITKKAGSLHLQSGIYETEAWGVENQQAYLNQCISINTTLNAQDLIATLLTIEKKLGRQRTPEHNYEPRTIDIDILFYNDAIINDDNLTIPHPRLHLRRFVLIPLNQIAPNYLHPLLNKPIFNILSTCEDTAEVKPFKA